MFSRSCNISSDGKNFLVTTLVRVTNQYKDWICKDKDKDQAYKDKDKD